MSEPKSHGVTGDDHLGVHSVDHFAFSVPDLEAARNFYTAFGLDVRDLGDERLGLYTFGADHRWAVISQGGERKKLAYVSFGAYEADIDRFRRHFADLGLKTEAAPEGVDSNSLWIRDPDGLALEIRAGEKVTPDAKWHYEMRPTPGGVAAAIRRGDSAPVKPRRLAHIALFSPDVAAGVDFFTRTLGLRLSDQSPGIVAFMHGPHGSDHHLVALAKSDGPGLHHISWDVSSIEEVGLGAMQMAAKGYSRGWGLGRHVLGSNYFQYIRDPWGSYSEFSFDIDYIPKEHAWEANDHLPDDAMFLWGPNPPEDFITNFETAA